MMCSHSNKSRLDSIGKMRPQLSHGPTSPTPLSLLLLIAHCLCLLSALHTRMDQAGLFEGSMPHVSSTYVVYPQLDRRLSIDIVYRV